MLTRAKVSDQQATMNKLRLYFYNTDTDESSYIGIMRRTVEHTRLHNCQKQHNKG